MRGDRQKEPPSRTQLFPDRTQHLEVIVEMLQNVEQADEIKLLMKPGAKQISLNQWPGKSPPTASSANTSK